MAPPDTAEDAAPDTLAVIVTLAELAGVAVSVWYFWRLLRQDPEFEVWRAKVAARFRQIGEQRRFADVSSVVPEAAYILSESQT